MKGSSAGGRIKFLLRQLFYGTALLQLCVLLPVFIVQQHAWGIKGAFLTGNLQVALGAKENEIPDARITRMEDMGDGIYQLTGYLPAGNYKYRVALNGTWDEVYGGYGTLNGSHIPLKTLAPHEVTFTYDNNTHLVTADYPGMEEEQKEIRQQEMEEGRTVILVGTMQKDLGWTKNFDPEDMGMKMEYQGKGLYSFTASLPPGPYAYKVAIDGGWYENYGADGSFEGETGKMEQMVEQPVTFYYNDISHRCTDSSVYTPPREEELPRLYASFAQGVPLQDLMMDRFYQGDFELEAGVYPVVIEQLGQEPVQTEITVPRNGWVTIHFDEKSRQAGVDDGHINKQAILHDTWNLHYRCPFKPVKEGEKLTVAVRTGRKEVEKAELLCYDSSLSIDDGVEYLVTFPEPPVTVVNMEKYRSDEHYDYWRGSISQGKNGIYGYKFRFDDMVEYGEDAKVGNAGRAGIHGLQPFQYTVYRADFHTPNWAKEGVAYQIMPDRFYNGNKENDRLRDVLRGAERIYHAAWEELPVIHSFTPELDVDEWDYNEFYGGDLAGIRQKLDYLQKLGVTAIYVNPLMLAGTTHRYDIMDYDTLDPLLGTEEELVSLVREMKDRGMQLIVDGVFNHVGADSLYFDRYGKYPWVGAYEYWARVYDLMNGQGMSQSEAEAEARVQLTAEGQKFSPYGFENWFVVYNERGHDSVGDKYNYQGWLHTTNMVPYRDDAYPVNEEDRNTLGDFLLYGENAAMMSFQKYGYRGWRLDASNEVPPAFWRQVRRRLKKADSDFLLLGEIWHDGSRLLTGDQLDSLTNYNMYFRLTDNYLLEGKAEDLQAELNFLWQNYPTEAMQVMMNVLGTHDTRRPVYKLGGGSRDVYQATDDNYDADLGKARFKLGLMFVIGYPGMPTIFYGDEAGLTGSIDPDNRRGFPWGKEDRDLLDFCQRIIHVRNSHKELLAHGDVQTLLARGNIFAYERKSPEESAVVILNRGRGEKVTVHAGGLKDGTVLQDALSSRQVVVQDGRISLYLAENKGVMLFTTSEAYHKPWLNWEEIPVLRDYWQDFSTFLSKSP